MTFDQYVVNPASETWQAVRRWAEEQRDRAITELCSVAIDESRTNWLRGHIACIDRLRDFGEPKPRRNIGELESM